MANYEFEDMRFNPDLTSFHDLAKQMAGGFGYTAQLSIDSELAQLLRLYVAQLNECAYCLILHTAKARELGIDEARISGLASWRNSNLYSAKEKAALNYCKALNTGVDDTFHEKHTMMVEQGYAEDVIAEIAAIVINMNVWTRLKLAQGATPVYNKTIQKTIQGDSKS